VVRVEQAGWVGQVGDRDGLRLRLAENGQHLACGGQQSLAVLVPGGDAVEGEFVAGREQDLRVGEPAAGPVDRVKHLGGADPAFAAGVDQAQGACVELQAFHGAGEHGP
jgi:hypothetical protein